ncbi:TadE/TadG family type IV pilus assembly protein [Aurantiacibacter sediminis]|uniref:Pilus assembly protein n=1 Tax=Aurantiacibacter sediminis TaxID=2793064 RepID=A0ABS0N1Q7_9SPHN|nr:TadE family protein [Aurantiacibacter sediminis]MBH5321877.1 pilus assembly protein [Aurantiacibacter sediminis]
MRRRILLNFRRLMRDDGGVTIIEFAFIAPVFFLMLIGMFDFGFQVYAQSVLSGAMQKAGRDSALEPGGLTAEQLDASVTRRALMILPSATIEFSRSNYKDFADINKPEDFDDTDGDGICNNGEPFDDYNFNGVWDADRGESGQGGARDAVLYAATITYDRVFPLYNMFGISQESTLYSATVLRNQPFAEQGERVPEIGNCE